MPTPLAVALSTSLFLLLSPVAAFAGADEPSSSPTVNPPSTAPAPAPIPAPASPSCRLGEHAGVEDADAQTSARHVCTEIARAGGASGASFVVDVGQLGSLTILTVTREAAAGGAPDVRDVRLHQIEDVASAAPRIAAAIVRGTPVEETRTPQPPGRERDLMKVHFALGILGQFPPFDRSASPVPGIDVELSSEVDPIEIVGGLRAGANSGAEGVSIGFAGLSMGVRYFLGRASTSAYAGAGFAWSYFSMIDHSNAFFHGDHSGLGAYGEVGLEFLHTRPARVAIGARVDAPFFSLTSSSVVDNVTTNANGTQTVQEYLPAPIYYVPVSLELRVTF